MQKSRERIRFEKFGILPDSLKEMEGKVTPPLHAAIVAELAARDDQLREKEGYHVTTHTVPQNRTSPSTAAHPFMQAVEQLKEEQGIDTASAMKEIVHKNPSLHQSYLASTSPDHSEPNQPENVARHPKIKDPFLQVVDRLKGERGIPTETAMSLAIKEHPDLYKVFMAKGRKGRA